jgi:tryptophan synthase alpha chain
MNRITQHFAQKTTPTLALYCTAGYPKLHHTLPLVEAMAAANVDIVEIGIPFSDPLADGSTIQHSNSVALSNGMSLPLLFKQLIPLRSRVSVPILLMGYLNPILQFGIEAFCAKCAEVGIDGLIIPDLPIDEYQQNFKPTMQRYGLLPVFLITPKTSVARIQKIDAEPQGFVYMVSAESTTGTNKQFSAEQKAYFARIQNMRLKHPSLIGFGISTRKEFKHVCQYASGAIIGSAFIKQLSHQKPSKKVVRDFVENIRKVNTSSTTQKQRT